MSGLLILLLELLLTAVVLGHNYCLSDDPYPNVLFGSSTSYEAAKGRNLAIDQTGCEIKAIWMLIRTGAHYPSKEEFKLWDKMKELKEVILSNHRIKGRGTLCPRDLDALDAWYPILDISNENTLTKVGIKETTNNGKNLVRMYRKIFKNMSYPATVMYAHSSRNGPKQTSQAFLDGMRLAGSTARIINLGEYSALSIDQSCPKINDFLSAPESLKESRTYKAQTEIRDMLREVSHRLGYSYDLSYDVIYQVFKLCIYETGTYVGKVSPWCAVFTKRHFKIFQNEEDILTYYSSGFGSTHAPRLGCPVIKNLFQIFSEIRKHPPEEPQVTLLFADKDAIMYALTALGIGWDPTVLSARNADLTENRMWNMSQLVPYSANLQVVMSACNSGFRTNFRLNDYQVKYTACNETCEWKRLKEEFEDTVDPLSCNFDFCSQQLKSGGYALKTSFSVLLIKLLI